MSTAKLPRILPGLKEPQDNAKIWRYMSVARLHDLLLNKRLSFSLPKRFADQLEGAYTDQNVYQLLTEINQANSTTAASLIQQVFLLAEDFNPYYESIYISCWQLAETESMAMWKNYADYGEGIAIQTRYRRLKNTLNDKFYIGLVTYCEDQAVPDEALQRYFCKRKSYEDEREIRAIYFNKNRFLKIKNRSPVKPGDFYYHLINPQDLIERIIISPYASDETIQSVKDISQRYDIKSQASKYKHENPYKMKTLKTLVRKILKKHANPACGNCKGKGYIKKPNSLLFCPDCAIAQKWMDIKVSIIHKATQNFNALIDLKEDQPEYFYTNYSQLK